MYLSNRDIRHAIETKDLIVEPMPPDGAFDTTSIDLQLDDVDEARVWDVAAYGRVAETHGTATDGVPVAGIKYKDFADRYAVPVPRLSDAPDAPVVRDGDAIILRPGGFFLWQTYEKVGTPEDNARLICFIDGKSTRSRLGILVHLTAPTIHAGWWGKVTLEIANLGPFSVRMKARDVMAQIVVAQLSSRPDKKKAVKGIAMGQSDVAGAGQPPAGTRPPGKR